MAILARNTTFVDGNTLASSDLHTEFDNIYNGLIPAQLEDESSDAASHQAMSDPTGGALPASLKAEIQQLRYKIDEMQGTTHWYTAAPDNLTNLNSTVANLATQISNVTGFVARPRFVYQDNDEMEIHGGAWEIAGRVVRITSATTVDITPTSSANWHYLYLDESNITALSSYTIDTSSIRTSTTAPTWSSLLNGWYNSSDRCIGAIYGDSTGIRTFYHSGECFSFAYKISNISQDIDTTWTDVTLTAPGFCNKVGCSFHLAYVDGDGAGSWRTYGSPHDVGHYYGVIGTTNGTSDDQINSLDVITDDSQKIQIKHSATNGNTTTVYTDSWYFPVGM